jgi:SAM-dependent methyltransferase
MALSLSKVANVHDFDDPDLKLVIEKYGLFLNSTGELVLSQNRKSWEIAMAIYSFDRFKLLDGKSEFLGIGVAKEETISILSNHSKRVFATDIYLRQGTWKDWHSRNLLINAKPHMGANYNHKRVVWQHVDGRELPYEDNSFDGIFSCSSIEHFGDEKQIRKAIEEVFRVLKPGGIAAISTEYKISGTGEGFHNVQLFDKDRLQRVWIDGINWSAIDFLGEDLDDSEFVDFERSIRDKKYLMSAQPHIKLDNSQYRWTSVHLTFQKQLTGHGDLL